MCESPLKDKKIAAGILLFCFFLASTPVKFIHIFSHHEDKLAYCQHSSHEGATCLYEESVNCHQEAPVVQSDFYLITFHCNVCCSLGEEDKRPVPISHLPLSGLREHEDRGPPVILG